MGQISTVEYLGDLRTEAVHLESSDRIHTDAPKDNEGRGEAFSPTDLVATSLASCMITVMGIKARQHDIDMDGTRAEIVKEMGANPRRISAIRINIYFPNDYTDEEKNYWNGRSILALWGKVLVMSWRRICGLFTRSES